METHITGQGSPTYRELTSLDDELLLPWLDLYETAFPPQEKVLVSDHLDVLRRRSRGEEVKTHLLAAVDERGECVAMARYHFLPEDRIAVLWYLAVVPHLRGQGIGSACYREILRRAAAGADAAVFEVEMPAHCDTPEAVAAARARIRFYKRLGAYLLAGIDYLQEVGHGQAPLPMHVMLHSLSGTPLDPHAALLLARKALGDAVKIAGELAWG